MHNPLCDVQIDLTGRVVKKKKTKQKKQKRNSEKVLIKLDIEIKRVKAMEPQLMSPLPLQSSLQSHFEKTATVSSVL